MLRQSHLGFLSLLYAKPDVIYILSVIQSFLQLTWSTITMRRRRRRTLVITTCISFEADVFIMWPAEAARICSLSGSTWLTSKARGILCTLLENHFVTGSVLSVPSVICLWRWSASTSLATPASYLQGNCLRISTHLLPVPGTPPLKPVRLICRRPQHILQSYQWCDANLIVLEFKLNIMYCSWYQLVKVEKLLRLWALLGHSGTILEIWETWKSKSNWIRQHSTLRCLIGNLDSKTNLPQGSNQPDSLFLVTRKDFHQKLFSIKILKQKDCHQSPNMTTNSITAITSSPLIKISKMHKALWIFSVAVVVV